MPNAETDPIEAAFEICKLQAANDGAFDEGWLRHVFAAAWSKCADMIGLEPPQEITEPICIDDRGTFTLSHRPTGPVQIFDGYQLIAVLPPSLKADACTPALCCLCHPRAVYMAGSASCELPPGFVQAVARVFAYILANRGDAEMDPNILSRSGAKAFLRDDLTFML